MSEYSFHIHPTDTWAAYDYEAQRAEAEQMFNTAKRQRKTALHLRNAVAHMADICPDGYRVECLIVVRHVPDVNPVLRDDIRENVR